MTYLTFKQYMLPCTSKYWCNKYFLNIDFLIMFTKGIDNRYLAHPNLFLPLHSPLWRQMLTRLLNLIQNFSVRIRIRAVETNADAFGQSEPKYNDKEFWWQNYISNDLETNADAFVQSETKLLACILFISLNSWGIWL